MKIWLSLLVPSLALALEFVRTPAELEVFRKRHTSHRLIFFREDNAHSLRLLKEADHSLVPTAAVLESAAGDERGVIPRVEFSGERRRLTASHVVPYGQHAKLKGKHYLMLIGLQMTQESVALFADAATDESVQHIYALPAPHTQDLFTTMGFKPWNNNRVYKMDGHRELDAFEFTTAEGFRAQWWWSD